MIATLVSGGFRAVLWGLAAVGLAGLVLAGLIASPLRRPPELTSISDSRKAVDFSSLPALERFQARDGTALGFRHYPPAGPATGRAAIVIHGSSGSSGTTIHALSSALAARGVETYAMDIRGHGASGTRGDIGYVGQLEDDLADFVAVVRKTTPSAPLTLIGHSAGGGFALRVAASPIQNLFDAHRAARALSRLRRPDQPAEFRRLGQRRYSAHPGPPGTRARSASTAARHSRCSHSRCRRIRRRSWRRPIATA